MWDCQQLIGLTVAATDGELGQLADLCFDDERWVIRYFVVNTSARDDQMLIALGIDELADDIARVEPVGRPAAHPESDGLDWDSVMADADALLEVPQGIRGFSGRAPADFPLLPRQRSHDVTGATDDHLRRVEEVRGYRVVASDGEVGRVEGFLISEASWAIEYIIVETGLGIGARKVVLLPSWIRSIDTAEGCVSLGVAGHVVLAGPEFTEDIGAAYESWLLKHLGHMVLPQTH